MRQLDLFAGLLMFGTFAVLRDALPAFHVDYREKLSADPAVRWTDRVVPDGTWESNVFQFYQRVVQRLSADLKIPFQLSRELYRKDDTIVSRGVARGRGQCADPCRLPGPGRHRD
jgi:ATP-dependent DNA helicase RecG